jgi:gluconate 2-dehydrogenase gamma chain
MSYEDVSQDRRRFLRQAIGTIPAAFLVSGADIAAAQAQTAPSPYQPTYFTADEWAFINASVDRLIPSSEAGPGGLDLHVPEFIDRQMATPYGHGELWYMSGPFMPDADFTLGYQQPYAPRELYRVAIADTNALCQQLHGKNFCDLDAATQDAVLGQLEKGKVTLPRIKAVEFFIQLLANTKEGYFADPMYGGNLNMGSWKMIGFPGARADYKDWVTQYGKVYPFGPVSIEGEKA